MSEEILVEIGLIVVGVVGHEGEGEGWKDVIVVIEGSVVGLYAGRVVGDELYEAIDEVGEEDEEEDCSSDEGCFGGDGVIFGYRYEGKDVYLSENSHSQIGLRVGDER